MKAQRFVYTALIATLLWPFALWLANHPVLKLIQLDGQVAMILLSCIFGATVAGVWTVDALTNWSAGETQIAGIRAFFIRLSIALIAATVFCVLYVQTLSKLTGNDIGYLNIIGSQGMVVLGSVWIAALIVDFMVRKNYCR